MIDDIGCLWETAVDTMLELQHDHHDFGNGLRFEWLENKTIIVYRLGKLARSPLDAWVASIQRVQTHCAQQNLTYYAVYDFSAVLFGTLTPYMRHCSNKIVEQTPEGLRGFYAVILPDQTFGHIAKRFMEREVAAKSKNTGFSRQAFFDFEKGVVWLHSQINPVVTASPLPIASPIKDSKPSFSDDSQTDS